MRRVLNVGGTSKQIALPPIFAGWEHHLLDIRPGPDVDLVMDARQLSTLAPGGYDAVYCHHNLEHYYEHEVPIVLAGFRHMLIPDGLVYVIVPDFLQVMQLMVQNGHEPDRVLYQSTGGPVRYCDIVYGFAAEIAHSGQDHYAHKMGFSPTRLEKTLRQAGFGWLLVKPVPESYEIHALASIDPLPLWIRELFIQPETP